MTSQARKALEQLPDNEKLTVAVELLPSHQQWANALAPFLMRPPNPSLALTVSLGGAGSLIIEEPLSEAKISYDRYGQSLALRVSQFTVDLIKQGVLFSPASNEQFMCIAANLALLLELAGDNLSVHGSMPLWDPSRTNLDTSVVEFIAQTQSLLADWLYKIPSSDLAVGVQRQLLEASQGLTSSAYYHGRAFSSIARELADRFGQRQKGQTLQTANDINSAEIFTTAAILSSALDGSETTRICNELMTGLTKYDFEHDSGRTFRSFFLLNCMLQQVEGIMEEIPQQRIIFFVKHVVEQSQKASITSQIEILRTLNIVLAPIKDIYGSFWEDVLEIIKKVFDGPADDEKVPLLATSLRLLSLLRNQDMLDSNDDLLDSWIASKDIIAKNLILVAVKVKGLWFGSLSLSP